MCFLLLWFAIHLTNKNKLEKNSQIIGARFAENSNKNNNANSYRSPKCISVAEEWQFICLHQAHCHQQKYFNETKLLLRTLKISNNIQQTNANFCHTHGSWAILPLDMNTNRNDMESNKTYEHTKTHQYAEKTAPWCFQSVCEQYTHSTNANEWNKKKLWILLCAWNDIIQLRPWKMIFNTVCPAKLSSIYPLLLAWRGQFSFAFDIQCEQETTPKRKVK